MDYPEIFDCYPSVYAVSDRYIITVPVKNETVMWVRVGGKEFFDDSNGILRSSSLTHKMEVPASLLNEVKEYTVCWRVVNERKPYFSDLSDVFEYTSEFIPVSGDTINMYHIADAHNRVDGPVAAAGYFGDDLDVLILNGDIPNHSGKIKYFSSIHKIAGLVTHGKKPVIFSRGNHDTRGIFAEKIVDYTPTDNGKSYFTVRLGNIWAVVLDCAEDKRDGNEEYGHTICCHNFRERETEFLRELVKHGDTEFNAPGVEHRLCIVHNPFSQTFGFPFDIEEEIYTEWCSLLREFVKPELMICGHTHKCYLSMPGSERDNKGQPCPVVCASKISKDETYYCGGAITITPDKINIRYTNNSLETEGEETVDL